MLWLLAASLACVEWSAIDADQDGWLPSEGDCDDLDGSVGPFAEEIWYDGVDQDCNGNDADQDQDGFESALVGGPDCWDDPWSIPADFVIVADKGFFQPSAIQVNPGAADVWYDDVDQDCAGDDDFDQDLDGFSSMNDARRDGSVGDDCLDTDPSVHPNGTETCNGLDDDCSGIVDNGTSCYDDDGDGFSEEEGDCDDEDHRFYPGAPELCDALDNDCDLEVDEDVISPVVVYTDSDGDSYGDPATEHETCAPEFNAVDDDTDCDDTRADVYPGASETCDDADQDCDSRVDEHAIDKPTWYKDADGDDFGDPSVSAEACDPPAGHVADNTDCDPSDDTIWPGAPELCDDNDNDCDEIIDEDPVDPTTWYVDDDGDGYGSSDDTEEECDTPSGYTDNSGDCDDTEEAVNPGATEICADGVDNDCDGDDATCGYLGEQDLALADALIIGDRAGDELGQALSFAGDVNGDGQDDLWVGTSFASSGAGRAYVLLGPVSGDVDLSTDADAVLSGGPSDALAWSLQVGGDVDNDGIDDLVVGGYGGAVAYLVSGPITGDVSLDTAADAIFTGPGGSRLGIDTAILGDQDGNGTAEVVLGMDAASSGGTQNGSIVVYMGPVSGSLDETDADVTLSGEKNYDRSGYSLATGGDLDGDGIADLVVGSQFSSTEVSSGGAAYLFLGPLSVSANLADYDAQGTGATPGESAGTGLSTGPDVDGDGLDDLLICAPSHDGDVGTNEGAVYLLTTKFTGSRSLVLADAILSGDATGDELGSDCDLVGDVDGDGLGDVLVGAFRVEGIETDAGAGYLYYGSVTGSRVGLDADATWPGLTADRVGTGTASAGDQNGDGLPDLLLGAGQEDGGGFDAGAVYLMSTR